MRRYTNINPETKECELVLLNKCEDFNADQGQWSISSKTTGTHTVRGTAIDAFAQYEDYNTLRPIEEWSEDYGNCLFWRLPIHEPPYCGTPLDEDWYLNGYDSYYTHFTRLMNPIEPQ